MTFINNFYVRITHNKYPSFHVLLYAQLFLIKSAALSAMAYIGACVFPLGMNG
jgi:hypothetical protein